MWAYSRRQAKPRRVDSAPPSPPEGLQLQSGIEQRGIAAHVRQEDDNAKRTAISREDRKFLNKVIHDRSLDHRPEFDERLSRIARSRNLLPQPSQSRCNVDGCTRDDGGTAAVASVVEGVGRAGVGADHAKAERLRVWELKLERERQRLESQRMLIESEQNQLDLLSQLYEMEYIVVKAILNLGRGRCELEQRWNQMIAAVCALVVYLVDPWSSFVSLTIVVTKWISIVLGILILLVIAVSLATKAIAAVSTSFTKLRKG